MKGPSRELPGGSDDIVDLVFEAAEEIEAELSDIYRDILKQGKKRRKKDRRDYVTTNKE